MRQSYGWVTGWAKWMMTGFPSYVQESVERGGACTTCPVTEDRNTPGCVRGKPNQGAHVALQLLVCYVAGNDLRR